MRASDKEIMQFMNWKCVMFAALPFLTWSKLQVRRVCCSQMKMYSYCWTELFINLFFSYEIATLEKRAFAFRSWCAGYFRWRYFSVDKLEILTSCWQMRLQLTRFWHVDANFEWGGFAVYELECLHLAENTLARFPFWPSTCELQISRICCVGAKRRTQLVEVCLKLSFLMMKMEMIIMIMVAASAVEVLPFKNWKCLHCTLMETALSVLLFFT